MLLQNIGRSCQLIVGVTVSEGTSPTTYPPWRNSWGTHHPWRNSWAAGTAAPIKSAAKLWLNAYGKRSSNSKFKVGKGGVSTKLVLFEFYTNYRIRKVGGPSGQKSSVG